MAEATGFIHGIGTTEVVPFYYRLAVGALKPCLCTIALAVGTLKPCPSTTGLAIGTTEAVLFPDTRALTQAEA